MIDTTMASPLVALLHLSDSLFPIVALAIPTASRPRRRRGSSKRRPICRRGSKSVWTRSWDGWTVRPRSVHGLRSTDKIG